MAHGIVEALCCTSCNQKLSHLVFVADTDMVTLGLHSLSGTAGNEVVAVKLTVDEVVENRTDALVKRIAKQLQRNDLVSLEFLGAASTSYIRGESFADFRKRWQSAESRYTCPFCSEGEMLAASSSSVAEFVARGGVVLDLTGELAGL